MGGEMVERARSIVADASSIDVALAGLAGVVREPGRVCRVSLRLIDGDGLRVAGVWSSIQTSLTAGTVIPTRTVSALHIMRSTGHGVVSERPDPDAELLDRILVEEGIRSWIALPIRQSGTIVALLAFSSLHENDFGPGDLDRLEPMVAAIEEALLALASRAAT